MTLSPLDGVNIFNISLFNPCVRAPPRDDSTFHVNVTYNGETTMSSETEKKILDGNYVTWDRSFSFVGGTADLVVTFEVFKTHGLHTTDLLGSSQKKVTEILELQNNAEPCMLEIGGENSRLTFKIRRLSSEVLPDIISDSSSAYELYRQIISGQEGSLDDFKLIVGSIMTAREPLTVHALENIFQDIVQDFKKKLCLFGSLFVGINETFAPIRPLDNTLFDFFKSKHQEENQYYIDTSNQSVLALGCLKLMNRMLCFNICNLETSHRRNQDIPDFKSRVEKAIPLHLSYACRFWAFHLRYSKVNDDLLTQIRILMDNNLLYWFEVLGLLKEIEQGLVSMKILQLWCKNADGELVSQTGDAWQFGFDFGQAITESTPHLYLSALPFTPSDSHVSKRFLPLYPRLFSREGSQSFNPAAKRGFMKRNALSPKSLAFSPQGKYIATGFVDGEFQLWDRETGEVVHRWKPRDDEDWIGISDIVFSQNEALVYGCFQDGLIRIFNPETKEMVDEAHNDILKDGCHGCTISSDGYYIAFEGYGSFLLYDRKRRQKLFEFDSDFLPRPMFSPNGNLLAFIREDGVACLWDTRTRKLIRSWPNDKYRIGALSNKYMAFLKASGTEVWDVGTFTKVGEFETGYGTVALFNDQYLLSCFFKAYSVWNISTGELLVTVESSVESDISSVAISPDSFVALITADNIVHVRQWEELIQQEIPDDVDNNNLLKFWLRGRYLILSQLSQGRPRLRISDMTTVNSTIFETEVLKWFPIEVSPNNQHVCVAYVTARGLYLWNDVHGEILLDEPDFNISLLRFSPAGDRLASIESNKFISIWDPDTHASISGPHTAPKAVFTLDFSAKGDCFLIAYRMSNEMTHVEVRHCHSGRILHGPFKTDQCYSPYMITFSANESRIVSMSGAGSEILEKSTGAKEIFHPTSVNSPRQFLSPDRQYIAWITDDNQVELWDIDHGITLHGPRPSSDGDIQELNFSRDSAQIVITTVKDDRNYLDVWEIPTRKMIVKAIPSSGWKHSYQASDGNHLVLFTASSAILSLDLDVCGFMSLLYNHHLDHSQFGMSPVGHSEIKQSVNTFDKLISNNKETLEYALSAWEKALFSVFAEMDDDGWILGPHGELLFSIPEKVRERGFWRPCTTHMVARHFTKLNFGDFVHGTRWTECRGKL